MAMSRNNLHDAEAEAELLPKHTPYSAASVVSDDTNDPVAQYRDSSTEDISLVNEKLIEDNRTGLRRTRHGIHKPLLLWTFFLTLVIFSTAIYFLLPLRMHQTPELHPVFGDCGQTPDEARARGCPYDPLAATWVRPECHYPDLIDEFIDMESVRFYHDKTLSEDSRVPLYEIVHGGHEKVWAPYKFHSVHCAHVVKKLHHALESGLPIDSFTFDYAHTAHCQLVLLEELPHCAKPGSCAFNGVTQKYTSCGYVY